MDQAALGGDAFQDDEVSAGRVSQSEGDGIGQQERIPVDRPAVAVCVKSTTR